MRWLRSRIVSAAALLCWGCVSVQPPLPLVTPQEAPAPAVERTAPDADAPVVLPDEWAVPIGRDWTHIVLHHSATNIGGAERFDRFHRRDRGWENGLGYHFVIGNGTDTPDGCIEVGPRWRKQQQGAHAGVSQYNEHGIGICLVGDFRTHGPTRRQLAALRTLVAALRERCHVPADHVVGHRDVRDGTECPGPHFPVGLAFAQ